MAERQEITVRAEARTGRGKNDARRLRARGMVPLIIYGGGGESVSAASEVLFLDRQIDPVRGRLVHADLRRLVRGEKVEVTVPLHLTGEPDGVRNEGGILEQLLREVEIRCPPRDIPDSIDADVSALKVHDVLHVSDLSVGETVEILTSPETVVATVAVVREEPTEPQTTSAEGAEPEVIGKGKKEDEV
jgi:large subunit ribosomal protein L25